MGTRRAPRPTPRTRSAIGLALRLPRPHSQRRRAAPDRRRQGRVAGRRSRRAPARSASRRMGSARRPQRPARAAGARGWVPPRGSIVLRARRASSARTRSSRSRPRRVEVLPDRQEPRAARRCSATTRASRSAAPCCCPRSSGSSPAATDRARLRRRPARDRDHPGRRPAARQHVADPRASRRAATSACLASVDAQVRIWKILAPAPCSPTPASITNSWSTVTDRRYPALGRHGPARADPVRHRRPRIRGPAPPPASATIRAEEFTSTLPRARSSEL